MKIKINLENDGLAHFFKPYEILGWDVVWNSPEPIGSGAVWKAVSKALGPGKTISRPSVIFFLNRQVALGFMGYNPVTGKGGRHRLYFAKVTMEGLVQSILDETEGALYGLKEQAEAYDNINREGPGMVYND